MTPIDTAELERAIAAIKGATPAGAPWTAEDFSDEGDQAPDIDRHIAAILNAVACGQLALDRREAGWQPETNILPWVALTIEQMRRFEASSGDLERLGLNGEWIPTDTPLSPGLVYRIKPTPTTEVSHVE